MMNRPLRLEETLQEIKHSNTQPLFLSNLKISNFKSYTDADVDFCPGVNCLVGNNGVGKTNLLDAVYYLSFCKSYFNSIDTQNIRQDEEFFAVHGRYEGLENQPVQVSCIQRRGQPKQMRFEQKAYKAFADHIGRIPLVMVSPTDQVLITGGSDVRRKFLNGVISQTDKPYLQNLLQYDKALTQRNRLLKQFYDDRYWDAPAIEIWDEQLVRFGTPLFETRQRFLEKFIPIFNDYYSWISDQRESVEIGYESQLTVGDASERRQDRSNESSAHCADFARLLTQAQPADRYAQFTTVGPHKDDLALSLSGLPVKKFASQGQQKTISLALKLAQFQYILDHTGIKPILLLDDIFDKLDLDRIKQLIQLVGGDRFGQVLLTDTQPGRVQQIFSELPSVTHRIFNITPDKIETKT